MMLFRKAPEKKVRHQKANSLLTTLDIQKISHTREKWLSIQIANAAFDLEIPKVNAASASSFAQTFGKEAS